MTLVLSNNDESHLTEGRNVLRAHIFPLISVSSNMGQYPTVQNPPDLTFQVWRSSLYSLIYRKKTHKVKINRIASNFYHLRPFVLSGLKLFLSLKIS